MIFIKYKDYFTHLLREASLSGSSRSAGIPNWDLYIVNDFDKKSLIDLLLAETLILAAIDSKIVPQNIHYWFDPIFELMQTNLSDQVCNNSQIYN